MAHEAGYIPALGIPQLTKFCDTSLATVFQEQRFRLPLVAVLGVQPGERVLDIGCGTGTAALLIAQHAPAALVTGLDIDPQMLLVAQAKAAAAGITMPLLVGSVGELPYADVSFECVTSSLMFHHLPTLLKQAMLREVRRVLVPRGRFVMLDFGPVGRGPATEAMARIFGGFEEVGDNLAGRVPIFLQVAGFVDVYVRDVAFGGLIKTYYGRRPSQEPVR